MAGFFQGLYRSVAQTSDRTRDLRLRTRYFRTNKEQMWGIVLNALAELTDVTLTHEVKSAGEILLQRRTFTGRIQDVTVTVIQMNPLKTAVDIYSASQDSFFFMGDLGSNDRLIRRIYKQMESHSSNLLMK